MATKYQFFLDGNLNMIHLETVYKIGKEHLYLVQDLMNELTDGTATLSKEKIFDDLDLTSNKSFLILAKNNDETIGILTIQESFAFYANGNYGIINELYVKPDFRSKGVGEMLLNEIIKIAKTKKWKRVDVTAPLEEKWERTVNFYQQKGFQFTGPKMKYVVEC